MRLRRERDERRDANAGACQSNCEEERTHPPATQLGHLMTVVETLCFVNSELHADADWLSAHARSSMQAGKQG